MYNCRCNLLDIQLHTVYLPAPFLIYLRGLMQGQLYALLVQSRH